MKPLLVIVTALVAAATLRAAQSPADEDFKSRVEQFLKKYSVTYATVPERFASGQNDNVLESDHLSQWQRSVTLKGKTTTRNIYAQQIYQRYFLSFHQYATSDECSQAIDSFLSAISYPGHRFRWGDRISSMKITPTIYIIRNKEIVVCKIHCEHENDVWRKFRKDLIRTFRRPEARMIEMHCGGPVFFSPLRLQ